MTIRFSCVVDRDPRFAHQAWIWATTLQRLAGRHPHEMLVHVVNGTDTGRLDVLRTAGIELIPVPRFDHRHPPSNKLSQLDSGAFDDASLIVLTDCDIAFVDDLTDLLAGTTMVAAKVVDTGKPPYGHWTKIFAAAGFEGQPRRALSTHTGQPTFAYNFNGGIYVLARAAFDSLRHAWPTWNRWLLDRPDLQGDYWFNTDQISFGLATHELGLSVRYLPIAHNYPTHLPAPRRADPVVLHHHNHLDGSGLLHPTGQPTADTKIRRVNKVLADELADRGAALRRIQPTAPAPDRSL